MSGRARGRVMVMLEPGEQIWPRRPRWRDAPIFRLRWEWAAYKLRRR